MEADLQIVEIYTDGACRGNPGPGGYGVVLIAGGRRKELSQGFRQTTNQRMEMMAVIAALEALKQPAQVRLFTDSKYVQNGITSWVKRWVLNGWKTTNKRPVKNRDLWEQLLRLTGRHSIEWKWLKGHAGHRENERCDELANKASREGNLKVDAGFIGK
ncbi:MAG TPA: ribonuclease HI [Anaerolineales bacterium]|nr:ribonuclease HI [Anaerolineales bacterium]